MANVRVLKMHREPSWLQKLVPTRTDPIFQNRPHSTKRTTWTKEVENGPEDDDSLANDDSTNKRIVLVVKE